MVRKRAVRKIYSPKSGPQTPTSSNNVPSVSGIRARITPEDREVLLKFWDPETLDWVLDNEHLKLGDLVEWGIAHANVQVGDDIDWAELERNSSDEDDPPQCDSRDIY